MNEEILKDKSIEDLEAFLEDGFFHADEPNMYILDEMSGKHDAMHEFFDFGMDILIPILIAGLLITVLTIAGFWKMFTKAGVAGWKAIIPIYNTIIMFRICGKTGWLWILLLIPYVGIAVNLWLSFMLARAYGYGIGMAFLLAFLPFIGAPILGFGSAKYQKPNIPEHDIFKYKE